LLHATDEERLDYTFSSNGTYIIKLVVNRGEPCSDSTERLAYVYPGFAPDFDFFGICFTKPTSFDDRSTSVTGTVNSWRWDFGELTSVTDISNIQNPVYTYPSMGIRNVRLVATNTDGCRDTIIKSIEIIDEPPITLAFKDTLICLNDQLQLHAIGQGNFSWSPAINMVNANTADPIVSPATTTKYYVHLDHEGCLNSDSVIVRVVDHVTLIPMADSTICSGDTIQLRVFSDGLRFSWTPIAQVLNPTAKDPFVTTPLTTNYQVTATIGGCTANTSIDIVAIPYPFVFAGADTLICFNSILRLQALTDGDSWTWFPANSLSDATSLNPIASPAGTTEYVFTAIDLNSGCPKPANDTIVVTVLPEVVAFAGNDTAIVVHQPLQLNGSGGVQYEWWPTNGLSSAEIGNPRALFTEPSDGLQFRMIAFDELGCRDSAFITVKVFATTPMVFVPSAFTPNNDGKNDVLRPIPAGIAIIEYFMVYNRWGQLIFRSNSTDPAWDGRINGQMQGSNSYVWLVKAIDYKGTAYFQKGTVTLIQ
jgi:gliding motility-associated-like protein